MHYTLKDAINIKRQVMEKLEILNIELNAKVEYFFKKRYDIEEDKDLYTENIDKKLDLVEESLKAKVASVIQIHRKIILSVDDIIDGIQKINDKTMLSVNIDTVVDYSFGIVRSKIMMDSFSNDRLGDISLFLKRIDVDLKNIDLLEIINYI